MRFSRRGEGVGIGGKRVVLLGLVLGSYVPLPFQKDGLKNGNNDSNKNVDLLPVGDHARDIVNSKKKLSGDTSLLVN